MPAFWGSILVIFNKMFQDGALYDSSVYVVIVVSHKAINKTIYNALHM